MSPSNDPRPADRRPARRRRTPTVSVAERLASGGNLSVREVGDWASMSRTCIYQEIQRGDLRIVKVGGRTIVTASAALAWLQRRTSQAA